MEHSPNSCDRRKAIKDMRMLGIFRTLLDLDMVVSNVFTNIFHSIISLFPPRTIELRAAGRIHVNENHF